jgi:hypothetical protein
MKTALTRKPTTKRVRKIVRKPDGSLPVAAQPVTKDAVPPEVAVAASINKPQPNASLVLGLLRRDRGATLAQVSAATGWLPHTTRAALTGIRKKGYALSSEKVDGIRTYRIASAGALP